MRKQRQKHQRKRTPNRHPVASVSVQPRSIVMSGAIEYMLQSEVDALLPVLPQDMSDEIRRIWYGDPSVPWPQGEIKVKL